ncbi:MAG: hypothetical protein U9P12_01390 [Verrucomicrobiota bacterium]|nr:hypothetical protein [Verrucomicrobiota bacterium]
MLAILTAWCEAAAVPYRGVPVAAIKRHATGKGNARKEHVIAAVKARGFTPAASSRPASRRRWMRVDIGKEKWYRKFTGYERNW